MHRDFWVRVDMGIAENRAVLDGFLSELSRAGFKSIPELRELPQGYLSKLLHIATHMLDGFFGVDSYFYNLVEDSHWISHECRKKIQLYNRLYWLIALEASSERDILGLERRGRGRPMPNGLSKSSMLDSRL
ncbi:MAG: hypothetical protein ACP5J5_01770 [Dissulfurimicrobium sp.]